MVKKYRNEWKYLADIKYLSQIIERLNGVMDLDPHAGADGLYSINSLYFDDYTNTCARENVAGEGIRFKYRIRYYGDDSSNIFLEKKEKLNSYCHKKSYKLTKEEYELLLEGNVSELLWHDNPLMKEFARDIVAAGFMPKSIVSYNRRAYVEPISNVRITFDSDIMASDDFDEFSIGNFKRIPVIEDRLQVLEVKFDDVLPSYIKRAIESQQLNQQSFSKYYMSRITLQDYYRL